MTAADEPWGHFLRRTGKAISFTTSNVLTRSSLAAVRPFVCSRGFRTSGFFTSCKSGWLGTNLACPTIRTTNDMPIVEPRSLVALGLVPFQINPHYVELDSAPFAASRDERIGEFLHQNDVPVVGLREGAWLDVRDGSIILGGPTGGKLFQRRTEPRDLAPAMTSARAEHAAAVRQRRRRVSRHRDPGQEPANH
jgi:hypothetical protein